MKKISLQDIKEKAGVDYHVESETLASKEWTVARSGAKLSVVMFRQSTAPAASFYATEFQFLGPDEARYRVIAGPEELEIYAELA